MNALDKQEGGTHYKELPIQPVEYCQRNGLGFCESSVVKYVTRWKSKGGEQDIRKAIHFLELLLELEYPELNKKPVDVDGVVPGKWDLPTMGHVASDLGVFMTTQGITHLGPIQLRK